MTPRLLTIAEHVVRRHKPFAWWCSVCRSDFYWNVGLVIAWSLFIFGVFVLVVKP